MILAKSHGRPCRPAASVISKITVGQVVHGLTSGQAHNETALRHRLSYIGQRGSHRTMESSSARNVEPDPNHVSHFEVNNAAHSLSCQRLIRCRGRSSADACSASHLRTRAKYMYCMNPRNFIRPWNRFAMHGGNPSCLSRSRDCSALRRF